MSDNQALPDRQILQKENGKNVDTDVLFNQSFEKIKRIYIDTLDGPFIDLIMQEVFLNGHEVLNYVLLKQNNEGFTIKLTTRIYIRASGLGTIQKMTGEKRGSRFIWELSDKKQSSINLEEKEFVFLKNTIRKLLNKDPSGSLQWNKGTCLQDFFPETFPVSLKPYFRLSPFHRVCNCPGDMLICKTLRMCCPSNKPLSDIIRIFPEEIVIGKIAKALGLEGTKFLKRGLIEYFENNGVVGTKIVGDRKDIRNWVAFVCALSPAKSDTPELKNIKNIVADRWKNMLERLEITDGVHCIDCITVKNGTYYTFYGKTVIATEFQEKEASVENNTGILTDITSIFGDELIDENPLLQLNQSSPEVEEVVVAKRKNPDNGGPANKRIQREVAKNDTETEDDD